MRKEISVRFVAGTWLFVAIALSITFWAAQNGVVLAAKRGAHLIMFEQSGCHYCETWEAEVGRSYHLTDEGKFAPLERRNIHDKTADKIKPVVYTPTFVLVKNGREVGRLTGYISEDFFWATLGSLLREYGFDARAQKPKS